MLWLIAAEYDDGTITASPDDIAWRLRMTVDEFNAAITPLIERGFFNSEQGAIEPLADRTQETRPETEAETQVQEEVEKIGGVVVSARAPTKSLISEEAFKVAGDLLQAMGLEREHPLSVGAPMTVQSWLNGGWPAEVIKVGVEKAMQNRKQDPPGTLKYFEKAIARTHAEMTRPLPIVEFKQAETITVTHGNSQGKPGSLIAAIDRQLAAIEAEAGNDFALSESPVRRISG